MSNLLMTPLKAVKYKNKFYKNPYNLYLLNKNEESPSYTHFLNTLKKTKSAALALKKTNKKLRTEYYIKLYDENKNENSVTRNVFIKRMRNGAKLSHALYKKDYKTLKSPIVIDGNIFNNLSKLAKHYELSKDTVRGRYKKGIRGEKLLKGSNTEF